MTMSTGNHRNIGIQWLKRIRDFFLGEEPVAQAGGNRKPETLDAAFRLLAFILPIAVITLLLMVVKVYPFGERTIEPDLFFKRHLPLLEEFRDKLLSGDGLFLSGEHGFKTNFLARVGFYISGPMNLLSVLLPKEGLSSLLLLQTMLRAGFAGMGFFGFFLEKDRIRNGLLLALSSGYALSGYFVAYLWDFTLADSIVLLPFIFWGALRIIRGGRPTLYAVSLFLLLFSAWRTGTFIVLFLILFIPLLYMEEWRKGIPKISKVPLGIRFLIFSVLAAGGAAIILFPSFAVLQNGVSGREFYRLTRDFQMNFAIFDLGDRMLIRSLPAINGLLPNIYCGAFSLFLLPVFASCKKIAARERIYAFVILGIFHILTSMSFLDSVLNGPDFSGDVHSRQALPIVFLLLYMAARVLPHIGELSKKALTYSLLGVLVFLVLADHVGETQHSWQSVFGTLGAVVIYYFCIRTQGGPKKLHRLAIMIFLFVALAELGYGMLSGAGKYVPGFEPQYENHPGNPYIQDRRISDFIEEAEPFILLEDTRPVPDDFVSPGFSAGVLVTAVSALVFVLLHRLNPGNIAGGNKRKRNGVPTPEDPSDYSYGRKDRETEETMPEKIQPEAIDCTEAGPEPAERKDR